MLGQCCLTPGRAKSTYGTGCFMLMNVGTKPAAIRVELTSKKEQELMAAGDDPMRHIDANGGLLGEQMREAL